MCCQDSSTIRDLEMGLQTGGRRWGTVGVDKGEGRGRGCYKRQKFENWNTLQVQYFLCNLAGKGRVEASITVT